MFTSLNLKKMVSLRKIGAGLTGAFSAVLTAGMAAATELNISPESETGNQLINWLFANIWLVIALAIGLILIFYLVKMFTSKMKVRG